MQSTALNKMREVKLIRYVVTIIKQGNSHLDVSQYSSRDSFIDIVHRYVNKTRNDWISFKAQKVKNTNRSLSDGSFLIYWYTDL